MQSRREPTASIKARSTAVARPEYIAAVRYPDGRRDLFHIRNANDMNDARALVLSEVGDVRSLMIARRNR